MIPYIPLGLTFRHAKVINGSIPTEKHGETKKAFFDLKIETLIELDEINKMLGSEFDRNPAQYIFTDEKEGFQLNMPDVDQVAELRENIRGDLIIKVGKDVTEFTDAHTVGSVNKMSFMTGGKGRLVLQFRVDPDADQFQDLVATLERGECTIAFKEYDDSATQKRNEKQDELAV